MRRFYSGWAKSSLISFSVLIPLALVLFLVHEKIATRFEAPRPQLIPDIPAWKRVLLDLPNEAAVACLVAFFLGLVFEYFVQRRHAEDSKALLERIDKQKSALFSELETKKEALNEDLRSQRTALMEDINSQRNALLEAAKQNLVTTIYKRKIPLHIFEHVENFILKSDFVRKRFCVHMVFQKVPKHLSYDAVFPGQGFCYQWYPRRSSSEGIVNLPKWPEIEASLTEIGRNSKQHT